MVCTRIRPLFPTLSFSAPNSVLLHSNSSLFFKAFPFSRSTFTAKTTMSAQTIEHIVLFKVKDDTDPSKVNAMVTGLNGLISLDQVLHLTAGPILRNRSSSFQFTHMLHSRYRTKEDLDGYTAHPNHMSVVKECVLPICNDIMAVDWVADELNGPIVPRPGSAMRVTFLKLKEGLGERDKGDVLGTIGGMKELFGSIDQITVGENFSPARAKGFSIASLAIFKGLDELDALNSNEEAVKMQKDKVRGFLESVIVVDYVIPPSQSATL